MRIYVRAAGGLNEPHFSWNLTKIKKELQNGSVKGAHRWGSTTHPQMKGFLAVSEIALPSSPVASVKKTVSGSAFSPAEIRFFLFPVGAEEKKKRKKNR